jgi:hypothetical protein
MGLWTRPRRSAVLIDAGRGKRVGVGKGVRESQKHVVAGLRLRDVLCTSPVRIRAGLDLVCDTLRRPAERRAKPAG